MDRIPLVRIAKALRRSDSAVGMLVARHEPFAHQAAETQAVLVHYGPPAPDPPAPRRKCGM